MKTLTDEQKNSPLCVWHATTKTDMHGSRGQFIPAGTLVSAQKSLHRFGGELIERWEIMPAGAAGADWSMAMRLIVNDTDLHSMTLKLIPRDWA